MYLSYYYWALQLPCFTLSHSQKLSFSVASANSLMALRHAAPGYPMARSRPSVEDPTKPRHPTSTRNALAFQPALQLFLCQVAILETFLLLGILHYTSPCGTVSSSSRKVVGFHFTQCITDDNFTPPKNIYISYPECKSKVLEFRQIHTHAINWLEGTKSSKSFQIISMIIITK